MQWPCSFTLSLLCTTALAVGAMASINGPEQPDKKEKGGDKEQVVAVDQLPAPVKATLTKEVGAGKIEEIEKVMSRARTVFKADVLVDQQKWEITIREDGQLLKKELDDDEDD